MSLAIVLLPIVVASALFQVLSPWRLPPVGSNRGHIDDTLIINLMITGVAFVAINPFIAACDILPNQPGPLPWS